jgi:NADH:ubiquinone oxidoreductase subunit 4 (subunit M)
MADSTDSSPTGDPHIAQSEQAEADAQRAAKAARLFDIRRLIGGLFLIYGVILVVLGLGESDASIEKSADINVNLYAGLGMLVLAAFFIAWGLMRPLSGDEGD